MSEENTTAPAAELIKAWKITPPGQTGLDALYIADTGRWSDVMNQVEFSLEQQMESDGSGNLERPWDQIALTITGVLMTQEEWDELDDGD